MPDYPETLPGIRAGLDQLGADADTQWRLPVTCMSESGLRTRRLIVDIRAKLEEKSERASDLRMRLLR